MIFHAVQIRTISKCKNMVRWAIRSNHRQCLVLTLIKRNHAALLNRDKINATNKKMQVKRKLKMKTYHLKCIIKFGVLDLSRMILFDWMMLKLSSFNIFTKIKSVFFRFLDFKIKSRFFSSFSNTIFGHIMGVCYQSHSLIFVVKTLNLKKKKNKTSNSLVNKCVWN